MSTSSPVEHVVKRYFLFDPNDGLSTYATAEARDIAARLAVDAYLDGDGWSEEVEGICVGEITGQAARCDVQERPKREDFDTEEDHDDAVSDWGGGDFDSICNYKIEPL